MKRKFYILILLIGSLSIGSIVNINAQTFQCRVIEDDFGYLVYQMRETSGTNTPTTSTVINDITFVIRHPQGTDSVSLICDPNDYKIEDGLKVEQSYNGYDYNYWNANAGTGFNPPHNWTVNEWEDICKFKVTAGTGSGLFEVAPDGWDGKSLNWSQTIGSSSPSFLPTIQGSGVTYSYPTLVYDLVWTGAANTYWDDAGNWETMCGGTGTIPNTGNNCVIPVVSTNYPSDFQLASITGHQPFCDYLRINSGASLTLKDVDVLGTQLTYTVNNDLLNYGTVTIVPNGELTVSGDTYIDAANGIEVQATSAGIGSFIDNGTITYGTSGTAKVQTYANTGVPTTGNFWMHLLGPTLDDTSYSGTTGTGADLLAFNGVPGYTYAYTFDETTSSWVNQNDKHYHVVTASGIGISTSNNTAYTLNMVGSLITGNTNTPTLTHTTGQGFNNLISNPYPSAIDFDAFATDAGNSGTIFNKYWLWDPAGGSYITRSGASGGQQYIQVGQAFFVQTKAAGTVTFKNSFRSHSNDVFRDVNANELTMKVSSDDYGFKDELIVRFLDQGATYGYDSEIDAYKWNSMYEDATQIESVADDGSKLAINFLPLDGLQGDMVSVPVNFQCGYNADYTFDFEGIDSFEAQNEVWLEDKQDNDQWIILNGNPHYTFSATPDDPHDRFILHFFGPTGINDKDEAAIGIYSWGQYAYIKNITNENIKKVSVYDISGHLVTEKEIPQGQKLSKIWVSDQMAYYVVQVITDDNVYTNKILITK